MKKLVQFLILIWLGRTIYAQSPHVFVNLTPAYPIAIGETATSNMVYTNNGIYIHDIIQDSLPVYEIGQIFDQTVDYTGEGHGFYIKADSLHTNNVIYSYSVDLPPLGPIEFNSRTGRFKYFPAAEDYNPFTVTFIATNGLDTVSEDVLFNLNPQVIPEQYAFHSEGVMPNGEDYTLIASRKSDSIIFNGINRPVYSFSISGKDIIFDNNVHNKVWGLSSREDIYELNIYAERLIIRSALTFPQTNITIYAKEVIFEDQNNELSSINTTPIQIIVRTDNNGSNGANAGNINIYAKSIEANAGKRFILNGGNGQSSNRNGTPGNGGNGGTLSSNLDIQSFCDFARGSCGVRYSVNTSSTDNYGSIIGSGTIGDPGHFELEYAPYKYLHPQYIAPVIRHITDAYINNYTAYSLQTCNEYKQLIDAYFADENNSSNLNDEDLELSSNLADFNRLINSIELGLDYFGNPVGWVPLLSFEVMLNNYQNEVDRAIPMLYLYYWLTKVDRTLEEWSEAKILLVNQTIQDVQISRTKINELIAEIPVIMDNIAEMQTKMDEVQEKITRLETSLLSKARHKVKKKNKILKAASICKAISSVASYCGPWGAVISGTLNTASNIASKVTLASGKLNLDVDYTTVLPEINSNTNSISDLLNNIRTLLNNVSWNDVQSNANNPTNSNNNSDPNSHTDSNNPYSIYNTIRDEANTLISTAMDVKSAVKHISVSDKEVKEVFNALCASSHEWNTLKADFDILEKKKQTFHQQLEDLNHSVPVLMTDINNDLFAIDAFRNDAFNNNSKRDLRAMQYLELMKQQAKNRLIKYHYYIRKAYEYRMLRPYEGEYNLVGLFERFETLATTMNYDSIVDLTNYAALASVFDDVISGIVEEIIDEYSNNYPEQSVPITIVIPRDQLDIINRNEDLVLNFYEMGIFSPNEENVRIVNIGIQHLETHVNGNIGYTGYMDLNMVHQGISRFRKDGQIYWFNHMSRNSSSPHTWGVRYDAISQEITPIQPSFASTSLLYSILGTTGANNMMLFSRPSAWGDITLSKEVHSSGGARIIVDSLVLRLQYDFTRRPNNIRNIDITTSDNLLPYIACSDADINGRSNGNGNLNRSYNVSIQPLSFTAIEQYGTWNFVNWTNRAGDTVSSIPTLTVSRTTDQFYRANYERRVPILDVPDTIYVSYASGIYTVPVANIGSGEIEMDWYVDDSLSSWVHLTGIAEGIDSGYFSFICDTNISGADRIDSLEIIALETDQIAKMIYIVQIANQDFNIRANVFPEDAGYVIGSGLYSSGDTAILIAIPSNGYYFSHWSDSINTNPRIFTVTESKTLTAIFESDSRYRLNAYAADTVSGHVVGGGSFDPQQSATLSAISHCGYHFSHWSDGDTSTSKTVIMLSDTTFIAYFEMDTIPITTVSTCDNYTWTNGITYSSNGIYYDTISTSNGCDSIISMNLTIHTSTTGIETVTACDSYTWHGITYISSTNTPTYTTYNTAGCDSVITLHLTVNYSNTASSTVTACDSYTWFGTTYTTSTNQTIITSNAAGCDSVISLHLTVNYSNTATETITACDRYTWHGNTFTSSTSVPSYITTNAVGCDSTVSLHLTINYSNTGTDNITACDSYTWNGTNYIASTNTPTFISTNVSGCDSVITLHLTINYSNTATETITACDKYTWHGNTFTSSTSVPSYITTNTAGCDSTVNLHLTIYNSTTGAETITACDSYTWNGTTYSISTIDSNTSTNSVGCDSITTLYLTINYSTSATENITACDCYTWINGNTYTASTNEPTVTIPNSFDCDSVITLNLTINYSNHDTIIDSAAGSYEWQGNIYTESGEYVYEDQTTEGCDSIIVLKLTISAIGISTIDSLGNINLYPNPTTDRVTIVKSNPTLGGTIAADVAKVEVFDQNGRIVAIFLDTNVINIQHLPTGAYTLRITLRNGNTIKRIIKQ